MLNPMRYTYHTVNFWSSSIMQLSLLGILLIVGYAGADDACSLPAKKGPCRAFFRRFYYNGATGECEKFIYGGCKGNGNNFETKEGCESRCGSSHSVEKRSINEICMQPKKVGRCRAGFPRVYYNSETGRCERFRYGGCDANENNFKSMDECEVACHA